MHPRLPPRQPATAAQPQNCMPRGLTSRCRCRSCSAAFSASIACWRRCAEKKILSQKIMGGAAAAAAATATAGPGICGSNVSRPVSPGSVESAASSRSAEAGSRARGGWQRARRWATRRRGGRVAAGSGRGRWPESRPAGELVPVVSVLRAARSGMAGVQAAGNKGLLERGASGRSPAIPGRWQDAQGGRPSAIGRKRATRAK